MFIPRRKKTFCYSVCVGIGIYVICQLAHIYDDGSYTPLQPLYDAKNEASRLLKFITSYHYQCNQTLQLSNHTLWLICSELDSSVNLETKGKKLAYSIGPRWDYTFEQNLARNYSFNLFVISHEPVPYHVKQMNNTVCLESNLVSNDYADFSRNSYGQTTINNIMMQYRHQKIDILKLEAVGGDTALWEVLHHMIIDRILDEVQELFVAVSIDKLDDDYLYSWYKALYELFYREGFRLHHTAASNNLCLQVTMMQSCIYYLSWIRDPGPRVFVMHPPADFGTPESELSRLLTSLSSHTGARGHQCSDLVYVEDKSTRDHRYTYCATAFSSHSSCSLVVISENTGEAVDRLNTHGCRVMNFVHLKSAKARKLDVFHKVFSLLTYSNNSKRKPRQLQSMSDILKFVESERRVSAVFLDAPAIVWEVLSHFLDNGALKNTTQIILNVYLPDLVVERQHSVLQLRHIYSELQRLESQGFKLFHSEETVPVNAPWPYKDRSRHQIGYIRREAGVV